MFEIKIGQNNEIVMTGRFDTSQIDKAKAVFNSVSEKRIVDFRELEYISSAGLGILLATQERLRESGCELTLINASNHIKDVFHFVGFDHIFDIE